MRVEHHAYGIPGIIYVDDRFMSEVIDVDSRTGTEIVCIMALTTSMKIDEQLLKSDR